MSHVTTRFDHAVAGGADLTIRPLPIEIGALVENCHGSPRLAAHLRVVHDVAHHLVDIFDLNWPLVPLDRAAICFGAATADLGTVEFPKELGKAGGTRHAAAGRDLLLRHGFAAERARFAWTHVHWNDPSVTLDDLVVALATRIWRGERDPELEREVIDRVSVADDREPMEVFLYLEEGLTRLRRDRRARVDFVKHFPNR